MSGFCCVESRVVENDSGNERICRGQEDQIVFDRNVGDVLSKAWLILILDHDADRRIGECAVFDSKVSNVAGVEVPS